MLGRLTHAAIALLLGAATFVGTTAHLCASEGLVRGHCCCHETQDAPAPAEAKRQMRCCEALGGPTALDPTSSGSNAQPRIDEAPVILLASAAIGSEARTAEAVALVLARGPPGPSRTPLYLQHRSLLN